MTRTAVMCSGSLALKG